jgi:hypothetical protein
MCDYSKQKFEYSYEQLANKQNFFLLYDQQMLILR